MSENNKIWYELDGELSDIVCSTGVLLSRNLSAYPFPHKLSLPDAQKCNREIIHCLEQNETSYTGFSVIEMQQLGQEAREILYHEDLITKSFAESDRSAAQLVLSEDHSFCAMLQEQDHICMQILQTGLALQEGYRRISEFDELLCRKLPIAFDSTYGYLTASPYHLGTGLQAYVTLHLPFLELSGAVGRFCTTAQKLGIQIEKLSGEEWKSAGVYRVSNRITLGIREDAAVSNLEGVVRQLISAEEHSRYQMLSGNIAYEDKLMRSVGVLRYARLLDSAECYRYLSDLRLAVWSKLIPLKNPQLITQLYYQTGDAVIASLYHGENDKTARCRIRAEIMREALSCL